MKFRAYACVSAFAFLTHGAFAASDPPLSEAWNIRPSGSASNSGELLFRVIPPDGSDPVEITVSVLSGTDDLAIARNIRRALDAQLRSDQFNVTLGEGANVLVSDPRGRANFSVELVTSDVGNLRVAVNATTPVASPTVPPQSIPAMTSPPPTPPAAGSVVPPANSIPPPNPSVTPPASSMSVPQPSIPPPTSTVTPPAPSPP